MDDIEEAGEEAEIEEAGEEAKVLHVDLVGKGEAQRSSVGGPSVEYTSLFHKAIGLDSANFATAAMGVSLTQKADGAGAGRSRSYRMVHNYKRLNSAITTGSYLPGKIQSMAARHAGRRWVCVLDQLGVFFACPLAKEVRPYTAFFVPTRGFFQYKRMPQGLQGSPATHQINTATAFHDLINDFLDVWMDVYFFGGNDFDKMIIPQQQMINQELAAAGKEPTSRNPKRSVSFVAGEKGTFQVGSRRPAA